MSLEQRLVLALSALPLRAEDLESIEGMISTQHDWAKLIEMSAEFELAPAVLSNIRAHFPKAVPDAGFTELITNERESRARALGMSLATVDLATRLEAAHIEVVVLKGPAISQLAYGDPALRTFGDVDLLVHLADITLVREHLLAAGFERNYAACAENHLIRSGHALEFVGKTLKVEAHSALLSRYLGARFNLDDIWRRKKRIVCAGSSIWVLHHVDLFLFLCAHGTKHEWQAVRWLRDIAQLCRGMSAESAEQVVESAKHLHLTQVVALALRLVDEIFPKSTDSFASSRVHLAPPSERNLNWSLHLLGFGNPAPADLARKRRVSPHSKLGTMLYWMRARERWVDRIYVPFALGLTSLSRRAYALARNCPPQQA